MMKKLAKFLITLIFFASIAIYGIIFNFQENKKDIKHDGHPFFCFIEQHNKQFTVPEEMTGETKIVIDATIDNVFIVLGDGKRATVLKDYKEFIGVNIKTGCVLIRGSE